MEARLKDDAAENNEEHESLQTLYCPIQHHQNIIIVFPNKCNYNASLSYTMFQEERGLRA